MKTIVRTRPSCSDRVPVCVEGGGGRGAHELVQCTGQGQPG